MVPGLSDDLQKVNDARKTAIIELELAKRNIDIVLPPVTVSKRRSTHSPGKN